MNEIITSYDSATEKMLPGGGRKLANQKLAALANFHQQADLKPSSPQVRIPEPSPYELYIRLGALRSLWPSQECEWFGELIMCCGFQASELCLRLIKDQQSDSRTTSMSEQRMDRFVDHLITGFDTMHRLLSGFPPPPNSLFAAAETTISPGFAAISDLPRIAAERIIPAFYRLTDSLPYRTGLEVYVVSTAAKYELVAPSRMIVNDLQPALDYTRIVSPEAVWRLREPHPFGPEDHLFSTVHQITECWLAIVHHLLSKAQKLALSDDWTGAASAITQSARVLAVATEAAQLLDQMVLADYHPLRVRLRDGSGAQSHSAQSLRSVAQAAGRILWDSLANKGVNLEIVIAQPVENFEYFQYLNALKALGKQIQNFLFQHYLLALSVLGTHSIGSLGYGIHKMAERAARPIFPEINQAQHDSVMLTNFLHGGSSGAIILKHEVAAGWKPENIPADTFGLPLKNIEEKIRKYFNCICNRDADCWVSLFDPIKGELLDCVGTRPYRGAMHLKIFVNGMFNAFSSMEARLTNLRITGNKAIVDWHFSTVSYHGRESSFKGQEEFVFDRDALIVKAVAHWLPSEVARQWQRTAP